jgi:transposase InsO family protein
MIPINTSLSTEGYTWIFRDHIFKLHRILEKVISDQGPQFISKFIQSLYQILGVTGNPSTAYHPQTDGQTERVNQEIE